MALQAAPPSEVCALLSCFVRHTMDIGMLGTQSRKAEHPCVSYAPRLFTPHLLHPVVMPPPSLTRTASFPDVPPADRAVHTKGAGDSRSTLKTPTFHCFTSASRAVTPMSHGIARCTARCHRGVLRNSTHLNDHGC